MDERLDADDTTETTQTDSADRITSQQAKHGDTSGQAHDPGSNHTPTAKTDHEKTDETRMRTESRGSTPADTPNGEQSQAIVSQVSHDLKSQLTAARGWLDVVSQEVNNDDFAKVTTALDRMETLIRDLEDGAAAGTELTGSERVLLPTVADQCWRNVAASGATLDNTSACRLQADSSKLKRVLENLFRNAVKHNEADVSVEVGDLDGADGVYVADDGSGIPKNVCGQVFETGVSTGCNGSGLGLSIVAQIVDAHGWQIRVGESGAGGARFEISDIELASA